MEFKPKNREWVKNAAIIFLLILLVLTFFSNTIMNRTLPEVATQAVQSGPITAKVRGTGTVAANGTHQVKADQTREIRAVMVKAGQEVQAGDVLFVLGAGDSTELEAAQSTLRQLQTSYQKAALSVPDAGDYRLEERKLDVAYEELDIAENALDEAREALNGFTGGTLAIATAEKNLKDAQRVYDDLTTKAQETQQAAQDKIDIAIDYYQSLIDNPPSEDASEEDKAAYEKKLAEAKQSMADAQVAFDSLKFPELDAAKKNRDDCQARLDALTAGSGPLAEAVAEAEKKYNEAYDKVLELETALDQKIATDDKAAQMAALDLSDLAAQIELQRQKVKELSGGEENEITANVSGTIQTVDCTAGDTKLKDDLLCTIEVPDMGYTLSFSVTNDQARRLRPGDSGTISNYYWGSKITATLTSIKVDPKNPQTNKLLTFDVEGDVNAGSELTVSVGQKSASYDTVVPNSAIRNDTNGNFVLKIEAKNSPLGNRYIARRVAVEVLASDDINSAVTGDFDWSDYVITTSNAPVKSGDQVRMADS